MTFSYHSLKPIQIPYEGHKFLSRLIDMKRKMPRYLFKLQQGASIRRVCLSDGRMVC